MGGAITDKNLPLFYYITIKNVGFPTITQQFYILVYLRPTALIKDAFIHSTNSKLRNIRIRIIIFVLQLYHMHTYIHTDCRKTMIFKIWVFLWGWKLDALYNESCEKGSSTQLSSEACGDLQTHNNICVSVPNFKYSMYVC